MYDGFERDVRAALDRAANGERNAVATFLEATEQRTGASSWEVFEAYARLRLSLGPAEPVPAAAPPRPSSRRLRRPSARKIARGLWRRARGRRRRSNPLARASRAALSAAGKRVRRTGKRLARVGAQIARRELKRTTQQLGRLARRQIAEAGVFAYSVGYWLKHRKWPTRAQLRPKGQPEPARRPLPRPSPAVAALLDDGYTEREAVYLFGARDDLIRDPADDWPGALHDFRQALRGYVGELRQYIEEVS